MSFVKGMQPTKGFTGQTHSSYAKRQISEGIKRAWKAREYMSTVDVITHITRRASEPHEKAWCGRRLLRKFAYVDIDHATEDQRRGNRLIPCKKCVNFIISYLTSAYDRKENYAETSKK